MTVNIQGFVVSVTDALHAVPCVQWPPVPAGNVRVELKVGREGFKFD